MYVLKPNKFLPGIILDKEDNIFRIYGKSCPVNAIAFYKPVINWLDDYYEDPLDITTLDIQLDYINTSTARALLKVLKRIERLNESGFAAKVRWFYPDNDEDILEIGNDFEQIVNVAFEFIPVENVHKEYNIKEELLKLDIFNS